MIKTIYLTIIIVFIAIFLGEYYPNEMDYSYVVGLLSVNLFSLIIFFFKKEKNFYLKSQYLKTSSLFLLGFIIVHFQIYVDFVLNFISKDNTFLFINNRIAVKSLLISSIAFNVFCLGYVINNDIFNKKQNTLLKDKELSFLKSHFLFFLSVIFLIIYFITVNKSYLAGNYGKVDKGDIAGYAAFAFEGAISALFIIKARNLVLIKGFGINFYKVLFYFKNEILLLSIYLLSVVISGERDILVINGLFFVAILLYISKAKFSRIAIFSAVIGFSFVITLLGIARTFKDEGSFMERLDLASKEKKDSYYYEESIINSTKELSSSARTLNIAVNTIEEGGTHTYGLFALQDLMLLIPSLKGLVINFLDLPLYLTSSAQYLTYIDQGVNADYGVGTSCVADTYLDFGIVGVIIIYLFFGFFVRRLELVLYKTELTNYLILTISLLIFSNSIYISRATILYSFSKLFYIVFFIYIIILINKKKFY